MEPDLDAFITSEAKRIEWVKKIQKWGFYTAGVLILVAVSFTIFNLRAPISSLISNLADRTERVITPPKKPMVLAKGKVWSDLTEINPNIYYADLEYDPQNKVAIQLQTGAVPGDPPTLLPAQPRSASGNFTYKVEVLSGPNTIIQSGWIQEYLQVVQSKDGKLSFRVATDFNPKSIVRIYLPDKKLIWTGQMPEKI